MHRAEPACCASRITQALLAPAAEARRPLHGRDGVHQSLKGSAEAGTLGGSSAESGMFSKFDTSLSSFTCGWYGLGISNLSIFSASMVLNHLCLRMSSEPAFRFP